MPPSPFRAFLIPASFAALACSSEAGGQADMATGGTSAGSGGTVTCTTECELAGTGGMPAADDGKFKTTAVNKRVVGYLPTYRSLDSTGIDFEALTHLCIAFANPEFAGGGVDFDAAPEDIQALVSAAHDKGVYVLASIAGAAAGQVVEDSIQPALVDGYVEQLLGLLTRYDLDGIDVDIEGKHVSTTYEPFVLKLAAALPQEKLLTAAVATWNGDDFSDVALAQYDFINVMSYDHCGSWTDACEHSTYDRSVEELAYWENTRALGAGAVTLGVPFYGYCWGTSCPGAALTYPEILAYPDAASSDYLVGSGYTISFNGATTIGLKSKLALSHGGIMIWELGQDTTGAGSLLGVIRDNFAE